MNLKKREGNFNGVRMKRMANCSLELRIEPPMKYTQKI
jgi:hypothetical protein